MPYKTLHKMEERQPRPKMTDVNPLIVCILCGGYYVDATTIIECMHSYCRACIVAYLRQSKQCPTCDTLVHKSRPMQKIRPDTALQKLVYKMVPGLYRDETRRRKEFQRTRVQHSENGESTSAEDVGDPTKICDDSIIIYTHDEMVTLLLEYCQPRPATAANKRQSNGAEETNSRTGTDINGNAISDKKDIDARYLRCPAAVQVSHLKKFIRNKFGLPQAYKIDVVHRESRDEVLREDYSLMDIAYIYSWKRLGPLPLLYRICEPLSSNKRTCSDVRMTSSQPCNGESAPKSAKIQPPVKVSLPNSQPRTVLVT